MASDDFSYLMPGHSEKHRRARNWTDSEMKALLYVWEEHHSELKLNKRNAKVYEKMSQRFLELTGERRHKEEIKMKITNMSFQFRRLKCTIAESGEMPDWPYYKSIEKILSKPLENGRVGAYEFRSSTGGPSTSNQSSETLASQAEGGDLMGYMPEYTGSSDEVEIKPDMEDSLSSDSVHSLGSSSHPTKRKRASSRHVSLKRKKLKVMQNMLLEQRKVSRAVEETCREVRRAMHQQNMIQVQCLQLQERMMNLLEKMIQLPSAPAWTGGKEAGKQ